MRVGYVDRRDVHSFPTRRSSDLACVLDVRFQPGGRGGGGRGRAADRARRLEAGAGPARGGGRGLRRSEEHTSELQSRANLVCRLLLEQKNEMRQWPK